MHASASVRACVSVNVFIAKKRFSVFSHHNCIGENFVVKQEMHPALKTSKAVGSTAAQNITFLW